MSTDLVRDYLEKITMKETKEQKNHWKVKVKSQLSLSDNSFEKNYWKVKVKANWTCQTTLQKNPWKVKVKRQLSLSDNSSEEETIEKWKWKANSACQRTPEYEQPAIKFATAAAQYLI